ncbi:MAG: AlpA family transcriptional regulator [Kangiellaceae bacterium]|nr:AlpA family transcriptional regulator [Kangiellaceae bacterium]MCW9000187.1 AlpA family transcriptional regulator [Kangiellaceae bacterium]MCW9016241.1 AlpA family transcriptional regulator [Kangiellaceae bacterium]
MERILRMCDVVKMTGLSRSTIYNLVTEEKFPAQIKLTERTVGWLESEVEDWLKERIESRPAA